MNTSNPSLFDIATVRPRFFRCWQCALVGFAVLAVAAFECGLVYGWLHG